MTPESLRALADTYWPLDRAAADTIARLTARLATAEGMADALSYYADQHSWTKEEAIVPDDEDDIREVFAIDESDIELVGDWMCETPQPLAGQRARAALADYREGK